MFIIIIIIIFVKFHFVIIINITLNKNNYCNTLYYLIMYVSSPDRLPHYVRVFSKAVGEQLYRYTDVPHPDGQFQEEEPDTTSQPGATEGDGIQQQADALPSEVVATEPVKATLTDKERKRIRELSVVNVALKPQNTTVKPLIYTLVRMKY